MTDASRRRGKKLVVQIPCYNEERTLPEVLAELPRSLPGFDSVEWVVVDDGSSDATAEVARTHGVDHVVRFPQHLGLARAFAAGIEQSLSAGADVIVNTDGDHQYRAADIPRLVAPILGGQADMTIGARQIASVRRFSRTKRWLQRVGSRVTAFVSQMPVADAPSGFRALSREAAMRLHVFNEYTYTIETIIQAAQKGITIAWVPIETNNTPRRSRLVQGLPSYVVKQVLTMLRVFVTYRPFRFFAVPGALLFGLGFLIGLHFVYLYVTIGGRGHVQSLILAALLMGTGFFLCVVGLVADLQAVNRKLLESLDWRLRRVEERHSSASRE
jgi:glycosyltransferase involved in cell wall biosynthesis